MLEVEEFEKLRRSIGLRTSDAILGELAGCIQRVMPGSRIGRIGRSTIEFVAPVDGGDGAQRSLEALVDAAEHPMRVDGVPFRLSVLVGAAPVAGDADQDELIDSALAALADARARHRRVVVMAGAPSPDQLSDLMLLRELAAALADDRLELHYQPKLRTRTDAIDSAEALVRWTHPTLGPVAPDRFIRMAEQAGAIEELTLWVLRRAVADQHRLAATGHRIAVHDNISGKVLGDPGFATAAMALAAEAAGEIGFEITETAVIDDPDGALANLRAFTAAGIRIAIDDYGSGLSSLAYLKQLPAHELKIDQMFVAGLAESHRDPLLVRSSIDLAHALEMEVTAEGVDDPMTLALLRIMGCDLVQGYLIARPMPLDALVAFLSRALPAAVSDHQPQLAAWLRSDGEASTAR